MAIRFNIRMAGLGGQGVVTASHIFSTAVINAGGESTIVPFYGSEKRMAPVESYVRVSDEPIYEIGEITFPHILMVFHPQCITHGKSYTNPFYFGLKQDGVVLINSNNPMTLEPDQAAELKALNAKIYYLPATKMSLDVAGDRSGYEYGHGWGNRRDHGPFKFRGLWYGCERSILRKRVCCFRRNRCIG